MGATDRAVEIATEGYGLHLSIGEQIGLGSSAIHVLTSLSALSAGGRLAQAETMGAAIYDAVVATPNAFAMVLVTMANGRTALAQGRPRTAERWFREGAAVARDNIAGDHLRWCLGGLALSLATAGDVAGATDALDEARTIGGLARLHDVDLDLAAAWIDAQSGDLTGAVERLLATTPRWAADGFAGSEARVLQACVSLDASELVAERLAVLATEIESPLVGLAARQAAAMVARDVDELEAVGTGYLDLGATFAAAEAFAQAARVARRAERSQRAMGLDRRARELTGGCEGAKNPTLFEPVELAPLTRREREIALMAANGLRSRDIAEQLNLSPRTVENHLHNAFTKLGISDRAELAAALGVSPSD
jgi:DNA-binding NarL/FixJ family response regulator